MHQNTKELREAWEVVFNRIQDMLIDELRNMPDKSEFLEAVMKLDTEYCNNEQVYEFLRQNSQHTFEAK